MAQEPLVFSLFLWRQNTWTQIFVTSFLGLVGIHHKPIYYLSCSVERMFNFQSFWVLGGCLTTLEQVCNCTMQEPKSYLRRPKAKNMFAVFCIFWKLDFLDLGLFFFFFLTKLSLYFFFIIKIQLSQCNLMCCCPVKPAWQKLHWTAAKAAKVWARPFFIRSP